MKPKISLKDGYFIIDTRGDPKFINYLETCGVFTRHYNNLDKYYCMANKDGVEFFNRYIKKHKDKIEITPEVKEILKQGGMQYIKTFDLGKWEQPKGVTLLPHQVEGVQRMLTRSGDCLFLGPGTGKTLIALSFLYNIESPGLYVVITPKKVVSQYQGEIQKHLKYKWNNLLNLDKVDMTRKNVYVTNYENLKGLENYKIKVLILDESHRAKSYTTAINKKLRSLTCGCVYLFTGTPQDKIQSEILYQMAIINNNFVGGKTMFLHRYFELDDYFNPRRCIRPTELNRLILDHSIGYKTEDLVDLTAEHHHKLPCGSLTTEYKEMLKNKILFKDGMTVVADSDVKLRMKLRQLSSGFCLDEDGNVMHTPKAKASKLKQLLNGVSSAIIYTNFDQEIEDIISILEEGTFEYVNGKSKDNDDKVKRFKEGKYQYLIINTKSGNAGLDLTITNNIIFYSLPESFLVFEQCKYRIRRIGQTLPCNYYYLLVPGSIDEDMLRALSRKESFSSKLFRLYKKEKGNE